MSNITNFPERPVPPIRDCAAPLEIAALERLAEAWGLEKWERDALLRGGPPPPLAACEADDPGAALPRGRVAMLLRLDRLLEALLLCGSSPREWIRQPRAEYDGRTPLAAMIEDPLELWLLCDVLESEFDMARTSGCGNPMGGSGGAK